MDNKSEPQTPQNQGSIRLSLKNHGILAMENEIETKVILSKSHSQKKHEKCESPVSDTQKIGNLTKATMSGGSS